MLPVCVQPIKQTLTFKKLYIWGRINKLTHFISMVEKYLKYQKRNERNNWIINKWTENKRQYRIKKRSTRLWFYPLTEQDLYKPTVSDDSADYWFYCLIIRLNVKARVRSCSFKHSRRLKTEPSFKQKIKKTNHFSWRILERKNQCHRKKMKNWDRKIQTGNKSH